MDHECDQGKGRHGPVQISGQRIARERGTTAADGMLEMVLR